MDLIEVQLGQCLKGFIRSVDDEYGTCKVIVFMAVDIVEDRPHIIEIVFRSVV